MISYCLILLFGFFIFLSGLNILMGKSGQHKKGQKQKSQIGNMPEDDKNHPSQAEISQPLPAEMPGLVQYKCGHRNAKPLNYTVDILVKTMKFVFVERDTKEGLNKGLIEFECVPNVDGSIILEFSAMVLGSRGTSPTKKVLHTIRLDVKEELGKKLMRVPIKFPIDTIRLKEPYKVEIKTEAKHVTIGFNVCQLTLAVIRKVNEEIQIRVTDQIVWVNEHPYFCHDSTGIFKALNIVNKKSDPQCGRCLVINNPGVLDPIGNISVTSEIGRGSNTTVFNGTFQERPCAVKKHPVKNRDAAYNDIKMMTDIGGHSNIVSYYGTAENVKFVLVAVESCKCSLDKLIASRVFENDEYKLTLEGFEDLVLWTRKKDSSKGYPFTDPCKVYPSERMLKILRGIVSGLCRLHSRNISHNNLKSQNVLISRDTTVNDINVVDIIPKLSNFSRSSTIGTTGSGCSGAQEPTFDGDLDDLGNLLLECITITRDGKTMSKKAKKINWVTHLPEAHDLITQLQNRDPKLRPTAAQVKMHPFFWGPKKRLDFLYYASDCVQAQEHKAKIRNSIYEHEDYIGWDKEFKGMELLKEINGVYNSYHGVNLLRVIRNKYNHYMTQSENLQSELGKTLTEFDGYFSSRFPKFFMLVYNLFKDNLVDGKNLLDEYFKPGKI